jgi:photosystem II stability/assembly factor-like uncharacterized protein
MKPYPRSPFAISPSIFLMILPLLCVAKAEARGYRWASSGPDGGPVLSIAFGSVGSHAMYCVAGQEVFRSTDRGDSWTGTGARNVLAVAADPSGGPVLYAVGGDTYRSGDSGATWVRKTTPPDNYFGLALAVDSGDPNTVYAGFFPAVLRSTDGGGSWQETGLMGVAPQAIVVDPHRPGVVFVASPAPGGCPGSCSYDVFGIWKSTDRGATWSQPTGLPPDLLYAYALAIDPMNSDTIYAGCMNQNDGMTIFKSTDGGDHWAEADTGMNSVPGSYVSAIAVDPDHPSTIYASSDQGFWRSTDGAGTWTLMSADVRYVNSIAVDPEDTSRLFASDYQSGLRRSLDGGRTWQAVNNGRPFASIHCLGADPSDDRTIFAGTDSNGIFRSTDDGASWSALPGELPFDSVTSVSVDPFDPSRIYTSLLSHGVYRSTDAGASWSNVLPQLFDSSFEVTAATGIPGLAYATTDRGLYASHDGGTSWSVLQPDFWKVILPEPRRPGWLYGLGMGPEGNFDVLLRSTDGGGTWSEIGPFQEGTNIRASLEAVSLDPADPDVLFCGAGNGGFFVTRDGGETWRHNPFVGATSIDVLPGPQERIFAGYVGGGVMESTDGGDTWISINNGLRDLNVTSVLAAGGVIHAGTSTNGVFEYLPDPDHLSPITPPPPGRVGGR